MGKVKEKKVSKNAKDQKGTITLDDIVGLDGKEASIYSVCYLFIVALTAKMHAPMWAILNSFLNIVSL